MKLKKLRKKPHYCILAAGSNDMDDIDRYSKSRAKRCMLDTKYKSATLPEVANWLLDLKSHQQNIVDKIRSIMRVRVYFLPTFPRHW